MPNNPCIRIPHNPLWWSWLEKEMPSLFVPVSPWFNVCYWLSRWKCRPEVRFHFCMHGSFNLLTGSIRVLLLPQLWWHCGVFLFLSCRRSDQAVWCERLPPLSLAHLHHLRGLLCGCLSFHWAWPVSPSFSFVFRPFFGQIMHWFYGWMAIVQFI